MSLSFFMLRGELTKVQMKPDYISVADIKDAVVELGYAKKRIKVVYFSSPVCYLRRV